MLHVGGLRSDGVQVGCLSSWGIIVSNGFLAEGHTSQSLTHVLIKPGKPHAAESS